jgi:hypothetical protein
MPKPGHRVKRARKTPKRKPAAGAAAQRAALPPVAKLAADMGALEYKRMKLAELRADVETARAKGRVTALCQLQRLEVQIHDEIEQALLTQGEDTAKLSSEDLMGFILQTLLELPQGVQDQVAATLAAVRDGSIVKLGDPGRAATGKRARSAKL